MESRNAAEDFRVSMDSKLDGSLQCYVPGVKASAIYNCKSTGTKAQNKDRQPLLFIHIYMENLTVRQQFYSKLLLA